jgi:hypothetical protein
MMTDVTRFSWLLILVLALAGCPAADDCEECDCTGDDDVGDDDVAPECAEDGECAAYQICDEAGQCVDGDRNNGFDEAVLVGDGDELVGYINPAGDVDYFRILGDAGWFFRAYAFTDDPSDEAGLDTVLRFYDAGHTEQGYNDTFERLSNIYGTDAVYMGCTPGDDTFYLTVEDYGTFTGDPGQFEGGQDYLYTLSLQAFASDEVEDEPNDDAASAGSAAIEDYNVSYDRGGVIGSSGDVDLWEVSLEPGARLRIYGYENSATELDSRVRFLDIDGLSEVAVYDNVSWELEAAVPVLFDAPMYFEVSDRSGTGGDDHCYVLHLAADNPGELYWAEAEPNDDDFDAEPLQTSESDIYAVAGRIAPVGDVDRFVFLATAGEAVSVMLEARVDGSSLAAHVRLLAPDLEEVVSMDVPTGEDVFIEELTLEQSGTYHLEVTAADPADGGPDHWYAMYAEVT